MSRAGLVAGLYALALLFLPAQARAQAYLQCPANQVLAGPITGPAKAPLCRALILADIPPTPTRTLTSNDITVFIAPAPTGIDTGNCLINPCATAAYAYTQATNFYDFNGHKLIISFAAGTTYSQSLFVNGHTSGQSDSKPFPSGAFSTDASQVLVQGAGSGATTLNGSSSYCATIAASLPGAAVGVRAIKLLGTGASCQSTLFTQMGGQINVYDDVNFGAASVEQIHNEDLGQTEIWGNYTISGNATRHVIASSGGVYINNCDPTCVTTLTGTPTFSDSFAVAGENGTIQWNNTASFSGAATGQRYRTYLNGVIDVYSGATLPGSTPGIISTGGRYAPAPLPALSAVTGLGTGGAAAMDPGSDSYGGTVVLTTGSASTAATGFFTLTLGDSSPTNKRCTATPAADASQWASQATAWISSAPSANTVQVAWANAGSTLTAASTYAVEYLCQ